MGYAVLIEVTEPAFEIDPIYICDTWADAICQAAYDLLPEQLPQS